MKGDVRMLYEYSGLWYNRLAKNDPPTPKFTDVSPIVSKLLCDSDDYELNKWLKYLMTIYTPNEKKMNFIGVGILKADDVLLSAVDFHCSPIVDLLLSDESLSKDKNNM